MEMETSMLYKLTVLYMLKKVNFALANAQIVEFFTDTGYTNYFVVQQTLSSLCEVALIEEEKNQNTTSYRLTEEGDKTLKLFSQDLSSAVRGDVDQYLRKNCFNLRSEAAIQTRFFPTGDGDFMVTAQVKEADATLFEIALAVPTEDEARTACVRFRERSADLYQYLLKTLLSQHNTPTDK